MAYKDFLRTWTVIFVDQTNMAKTGGTLQIDGPQDQIKFTPQNMGVNNDAWAETNPTYDEETNQIIGLVGPTVPPNPYVMAALVSPVPVLVCSIGPQVIQGDGGSADSPLDDGEAGSWTANDGGGQVLT